MMRRSVLALLAVVAVLSALLSARHAGHAFELPDRLTDAEFWALSQDASEPGGYFRSADITNLTSNELRFLDVIPDLVTRVKPGGVYLGVGPEQNYTYIAAIKPKMAVIFDVRRGNLDLQLMYKAIFELSKDRADFVSILFAKPRPAGLGASSSAADIFGAFAASDTTRTLFDRNLIAIKDYLLKTRRLPVPARDLDAIDTIYQTFYSSGYYLRASPSYWDLMTTTDAAGAMRSYLATESNFAVMKDLQARNLVVPVVGNFGGPKAIRAIGQWLEGAWRHGIGVLFIECRAVPRSGWFVDFVLPERGHAAARRVEHVHSLAKRRRWRTRRQFRQLPRRHGRRNTDLPVGQGRASLPSRRARRGIRPGRRARESAA